ncbi:MAG: SpoIIE family protein phosphatase, partial [Streptosporangiaceae bacterium]|nr:SpoIIE family protein phosphatase [Streptosporangiaceae bacterium]
GIEEEVRQGVRIPIGKGFAGRVAAERHPVILDHVDHSTVINPLLEERGIRALLGVPLLGGGAVLGVLHVGSLTPRVFTADEAALLQLAADRAALAVQSLMSREDRQAAVALQRSLVPSALPAIPGVRMAARYVTGDGAVGGDWYDVFILPSGGLGVVVGDVAGSGLRAAVIMGRMRSALRAYALEASDPADALSRLDRKIQYFEPDAMATVLYAVLDPISGGMAVSSAGHIPPVLAVPGQPAEPAAIAVDVPVGVADAVQRHITTVHVPPGGLACFYTDGLVERRNRSLDEGISMLCAAIRTSSPEEACVQVMGALIGNEQVRDDVAVVMLHRTREAGRTLEPA